MIINLWSTPRTGSVWYSYHLKKFHHPAILLTEPFNRYHMNLYHHIVNGKLINLDDYVEGSFYKDYFLENGKIIYNHNYNKRSRSIQQEEDHMIGLLDKINKDDNYIIHNHVHPISDKVLHKLIEIGDNLWIYRKDKVAQLASYAIAFATKEFVRFNKNVQTSSDLIEIRDVEPLRRLINRIKIWDNLSKDKIIAYEDIEFYELPGMPYKQNNNYTNLLSDNSIKLIHDLLDEYYYN